MLNDALPVGAVGAQEIVLLCLHPASLVRNLAFSRRRVVLPVRFGLQSWWPVLARSPCRKCMRAVKLERQDLEDDLAVRYEPDTAKRFASVFLLNPSTTYHWNFTWGPNIRLVMQDGGVKGNTLYDFGMAAPRGRYDPPQHYAYLGAPVGRSGNESASIAGTIYRNVWIANRPRPQSLGSALRDH